MTLQGKGLVGAAAVLLGSAAAAIGITSKASWNRNNPVAKAWLSENNFSPRDKAADFENSSNDGWFALGCHKVLFGGKNFAKLYDNNSITNPVAETSSSPDNFELQISDLFTNINEPLLGCSTAYLQTSGSNKIYQYELALRQGNKGFEERISAYTEKIISQLVFYEKKPQEDPSKTPEYKHLFGLYRYIKKDSSSNAHTYKVANPNPKESTTAKWSNLDLSSGNSETQSRYYSFWVEDNKVEGIFDNLGVKLDDKQFSSVAKGHDSSSTGSSKFVYVNSKDEKGDLKKSTDPLVHYDLSVLDSLVNRIQERKGLWKSAEEFCSNKPTDDSRQPLSEVQRLSQYCYEIKKETTTSSTPQPQS